IASDDFFGLLDPGESVHRYSMLDLAVGRVSSRTPEEAAAYLEKLQAFDDPAKAGAWRGRVVFAADDDVQKSDKGDGDPVQSGHTTDSDDIRKGIAANRPGTSFESVYMLDYPMNSAYHKPEAAKDLLTLINRGALAVNYIGHGSSNQWADEVLLQTNDALARLDNAGKTPMV